MNREVIMRALAEVHDPELHKPLTELKMIRDVQIDGNDVRVEVALTTGACPLKNEIADAVKRRLEMVEGVGKVEVDLGEMTQEERDELFGTKLNAPILTAESPTRIIGVASGKGGVGKSTV